MKMSFCKFFAVAVSSASLASAFSLYDTAPMVGSPDPQNATYSLNMSLGGDTNPMGSTDKRQQKSSAYVNASISTSFADVESVDKLTYGIRLGGTHYLNTQNSGGRKYYADCNADITFRHAFSARSNYMGVLHLSYLPEPGYDNGFSSASMQGDTLSWSMDNRYSEAIDGRWSWNIGANVSGTKYEEKAYSYDDRQYYSVSLGLNYRESDRLTYTSSASYRDELRSTGMDSSSAFATLGFQYALDTVSSVSFSGGAQCKMMNHRNTVNPTIDLGYRRRVTDGLSVNAYVKYSDENVDNYNSSSKGSYRSCATWRMGAYGTYALSPIVSYTFRMQIMQTQYRKPTNDKTRASERYTINPSLSMNYNFSPSVVGTLSTEYTFYHYGRERETSKYSRLRYSAGLSYRF